MIELEFDVATPEPPPPAIKCVNLVHVYGVPGSEVAALRGIDLEVQAGAVLALLGPSGSGKSTLLWHVAGLLSPTAGTVEVGGQLLSALTGRELADLRLREVGVVMQNPGRNLLGHLSALENLVMVQRPTRRTRRVQLDRAKALLDSVGLTAHTNQLAARLSGGEQQRLAVAVALANGPRVLLADEPTSHLDAVSAEAVTQLILGANKDLGTTVVVVTHDESLGAALGHTVTIRDGLIGRTSIGDADYLVVGRGGSVQLPSELLSVLPPGSLVRATVEHGGVLLSRHEAGHEAGQDGNYAPRHGGAR